MFVQLISPTSSAGSVPPPRARTFGRWLQYTASALLLAGGPLACGDDGTGPQPADDTTPPSVLSLSPADGSVRVSVLTTIGVTFSEPLAAASVSSGSFVLEAGPNSVTGSLSQSGRNVIFTPGAPLDFSTPYTARLTTALTDTAGNALGSERSWTFTTAPSDAVQLSETAILSHLTILAADSLNGRRAGSGYEVRAAEYIRGQFQGIGLDAGAPNYFQTFDINFAVDGQTGLTSQNVLGVLPGEGSLAGQWVIVGSHYDHLGVVQVSADSFVVYNGADDNASGTSLMMDLARGLRDLFARSPAGAGGRRSIMFQAYGSEEVGLVGSAFFCSQPTVPMDSIVAMVNLDMVGRLRDDILIMIGTSSSSEWPAALDDANVHSLTLAYEDAFLASSDQYCFYQNSRPVAFLHTGLHIDYHTPFDDFWLLNLPGMLRVGDLAGELVVDLTARPDRLPFTANPVVEPGTVVGERALALPR